MYQQTANEPGPAADPQGWREIRHFAYMDRPFRNVRRAVATAPQRILAGSSELRVRRVGFDLARDVRMILGDVEIGIHSARLPIRWEETRGCSRSSTALHVGGDRGRPHQWFEGGGQIPGVVGVVVDEEDAQAVHHRSVSRAVGSSR